MPPGYGLSMAASMLELQLVSVKINVVAVMN